MDGRKLFFSAVALVAFSSVSMGNTIEIEGLESKDQKVEIVGARVFNDPCLGSFLNTYAANVQEYGSEVVGQIAIGAWNACRKALGLDGN